MTTLTGQARPLSDSTDPAPRTHRGPAHTASSGQAQHSPVVEAGMRGPQRLITVIAAAAVGALVTCTAAADSTSAHAVRIRVESFSAIVVEGGAPGLGSAGAKSVTHDVVAGSTWNLRWMTNLEGQKITVASEVVSSTSALIVEATDVTGGTSAGRVLLSGTNQDLIVGLSPGFGHCQLRYSASASGERPPVSGVCRVTYTLVGGE